MKKGSILVLVLGLVLILSYITVSFLENINTEITHIDQLNQRYDYYVHVDSILSMVIANLYSYINRQITFTECCTRIDKKITDVYGDSQHVNIHPLDGRIALIPENLGIIEQLFSQNGVSLDCFSGIANFLEKKNAHFGWPIEALLEDEDIREFFTDDRGFLTENWQLLVENTTTERTGGLNILFSPDAVLRALCALEGWDIGQVQACIHSKNFLDNFEEDFLQELQTHGLTDHEFLSLKNDLSTFVVNISPDNHPEKYSQNFLITIDPEANYNGLPFVVTRRMYKI